jgi:hypothetical protein
VGEGAHREGAGWANPRGEESVLHLMG